MYVREKRKVTSVHWIKNKKENGFAFGARQSPTSYSLLTRQWAAEYASSSSQWLKELKNSCSIVNRSNRSHPWSFFPNRPCCGSGSGSGHISIIFWIRIGIKGMPIWIWPIRIGINSKQMFLFYHENFKTLSKILKIMIHLPLMMRKEKHT
jgi:hypothetical protein